MHSLLFYSALKSPKNNCEMYLGWKLWSRRDTWPPWSDWASDSIIQEQSTHKPRSAIISTMPPPCRKNYPYCALATSNFENERLDFPRTTRVTVGLWKQTTATRKALRCVQDHVHILNFFPPIEDSSFVFNGGYARNTDARSTACAPEIKGEGGLWWFNFQ